MSSIVVVICYANGTIFVDLPHYIRFWIATLMMIVAFILVAVACHNDENKAFFAVAVIASALMATGKGMGEATFLGFCNLYPKYVVGYVSQGTGCAGLTGVLINLVF